MSWSLDVSAIRSPVKFEVFGSVRNGPCVVVLVKVLSCFVAGELKKAIFEGQTGLLMLNEFDGIQLLFVTKGIDERGEVGLIHPRL